MLPAKKRAEQYESVRIKKKQQQTTQIKYD